MGTLIILIGAGVIIYHLTRLKAAGRSVASIILGEPTALHTVAGIVSHLRNVTYTHGSTGGSYGGRVTTSHVTLFRVDGHPVTMDGVINVDNGDNVVVAGVAGNDGMKALALRDTQSGLMFTARPNEGKLTGGVIATLAGFLGFLFTPLFFVGAFGIFLIVDFTRDSNRIRTAQASLSPGVPLSLPGGSA